MHKLIDIVEDEIEKFENLRKVRKDKKSIVNDKVRKIDSHVNKSIRDYKLSRRVV